MNLKKDNRGIGKSVIIIILAIVAALAIGGAYLQKIWLRRIRWQDLLQVI